MEVPDLCWLFNVAPGYRMVYAENISKTGGPNGPRKRPEPRPDLVGNNGVMSEASRRGYVPREEEG